MSSPRWRYRAWLANQATDGTSTEPRLPRNQVKPTAIMSTPVLLSGRRYPPTRPQATKDQPDSQVRYPMARVVPTERNPFGNQSEQCPCGGQDQQAEPAHADFRPRGPPRPRRTAGSWQ
jgi:hypothetical protein